MLKKIILLLLIATLTPTLATEAFTASLASDGTTLRLQSETFTKAQQTDSDSPVGVWRTAGIATADYPSSVMSHRELRLQADGTVGLVAISSRLKDRSAQPPTYTTTEETVWNGRWIEVETNKLQLKVNRP